VGLWRSWQKTRLRPAVKNLPKNPFLLMMMATGLATAKVGRAREHDGWMTMGPLLAFGVVVLLMLDCWRRSGQPLVHFLGLGFIYLYVRLWHRGNVGGSPLAERGPAILVANHTASADPAFLQAAFRRPLSFMLAQEYYVLPGVRPLCDYIGCVPVARNGRDTAGVRMALRRLQQGHILCMFPEGGLSNAGRRRIRPSKSGVALLALRSGAPVYPAFITGGPQTSDVPTAWLRPSRTPVRVTFGPAIDLSAYHGRPIERKLLDEVTAGIMSRVAALDPAAKLHESPIPACA
jgi:1-acyl-sn-glycerol-3-phosphate acyltransferase